MVREATVMLFVGFHNVVPLKIVKCKLYALECTSYNVDFHSSSSPPQPSSPAPAIQCGQQ